MTPMRDGRGAWAPWGGSVRFAGRVAARHARRSVLDGVAGRVMVRAARAGGRIVTVRDGRALRLEVRVRVDIGGVENGGRRAGAAWGAPPNSTYARPRALVPSIGRTADQLAASRDRIERVPAGRRRAPSTTAASYASAFPPVPRVVTRGTPNDASVPSSTPDLALRRPDRAPAPSRTPATAPSGSLASFTPPELDRLTSHVVNVIDRRLAAYRERHGRG
jgi:hypothetical protein